MKGWTGQLWPLALVLVFYVVPLEFLTSRQLVIFVPDETTRILVVAVLAVAFLFGAAALVCVGLALATSLLQIVRPTPIADLRRAGTYAAWAGGLALPTVAILLALSNPLYALVYAVLVGFYLLYAMPGSRRLIGYRSSITVRCPPETAFAFISDPHNWRRYLPEIQVVDPIDAPLRVGSTVTERVTLGRRVVVGRDEITLVDPNRKLAMQAAGGKATGFYEFKPVDAGTEISYSSEHRLSVSEAVIGGVLRRGALVKLLLSRREVAMQRIKQILEAPPATTV